MKDRTEKKLQAMAGTDTPMEDRTDDRDLDILQAATHAAERKDGGHEDARPRHGLTFRRRNTTRGINPLDEVKWELRDASIVSPEGEVIFEQEINYDAWRKRFEERRDDQTDRTDQQEG